MRELVTSPLLVAGTDCVIKVLMVKKGFIHEIVERIRGVERKTTPFTSMVEIKSHLQKIKNEAKVIEEALLSPPYQL